MESKSNSEIICKNSGKTLRRTNSTTSIKQSNLNNPMNRSDFLLQRSPFGSMNQFPVVPSVKMRSQSFIENTSRKNMNNPFLTVRSLSERSNKVGYLNNLWNWKTFYDKLAYTNKINKNSGTFKTEMVPATETYHHKFDSISNVVNPPSEEIKNNGCKTNETCINQFRNSRSKSFLSSTFASRQKNILNKVKSLDCLVPPIVKGHVLDTTFSVKYHIPYSDQNQLDTKRSCKKQQSKLNIRSFNVIMLKI